jgi:hypothetical protein
MLRLILGVVAGLAVAAAAGCHGTEDKSAPAKPVGTPPPSASNIPPPLPPGKSPGPAGMR